MGVNHEAFGVIEMQGGLGLIDVVDAMSKSAEVDLVGYAEGPITSVIIIAGECKSVLAVLEVGRHIGLQYDDSLVFKLIPDPHPNTRRLIQDMVQSKDTHFTQQLRG